jgi:hypothetical protein
VVAEDSTSLEFQQANFSDRRPKHRRRCVFRQDLDVSIAETTDAELIEMIVPPVECGLNSEKQMLQVSMNRQDQTALDARLDVVDGNPDLHSDCGFEHCPNKVGRRSSDGRSRRTPGYLEASRVRFSSRPPLTRSGWHQKAVAEPEKASFQTAASRDDALIV